MRIVAACFAASLGCLTTGAVAFAVAPSHCLCRVGWPSAAPTPCRRLPAGPPPVGALQVSVAVVGTFDPSLGEGGPYVVQVSCDRPDGTVTQASLTFDSPATQTVSDLPA